MAPVSDFDSLRGSLLAGAPRYSHGREESIIRSFFLDRRHGVFVDVGCAAPVTYSTTYYLEKHLAWTGIAVDADPRYAEAWRRLRPCTRLCQYVVCDRTGELVPFYAAGWLGSTEPARTVRKVSVRGREIAVPSITLDVLLERAAIERIDFLSLDIEGSEPRALAGFDIERFRPELVCIEHGRVRRSELAEWFASRGYRRLEQYREHDRINDYYTPVGASSDASELTARAGGAITLPRRWRHRRPE